MPEALQLLREDHNKVKQLFKQFEQADEKQEKQRIANEALMELEIHAEIEEEIFYPRMMKQPGAEEMMLEAEEEHAVAKNLIAELRAMRSVNERYEAKFKVLSEYVLHHMQEEEEQMFPKAAELGRDFLNEAGSDMSERKLELMHSGGAVRRKRAASAPARRGTASRPKAGGRTSRAAAGSRRTSRTTSRSTSGPTGTRATGTRKSATTARGGTRTKAAGARSTAGTRSSTAKRVTATARAAATRTRSAAARATGTRKASSTTRSKSASGSTATRRTSTRKSA